jgi:hypothetical protein
VQRTDEAPTSAVVGRMSLQDQSYLAKYQDWQMWARRYSRQLGVVRFSAGITADTCARCIPRIEERDDNGDWNESEDERFLGLFDGYANPRQTHAELVRLHAWHYQIAGEMFQVVVDGPGGVEWWLYSTGAVELKGAVAIVKTTPNGNVREGTAFAVPRQQVTRFWIPDEEWQALATSPMAASVDDLHRYWSLARMIRRTADSRLIMNGILWTPGEAHETGSEEAEAPVAGTDQP